MDIPCYIYCITHVPTGKKYVGRSVNPEKRYASHIASLRHGKHKVKDMQEDYFKYGEDYTFEILDRIDEFDERCKEAEWALKLESNIRAKGYNYQDRSKILNNWTGSAWHHDLRLTQPKS